VAWGLAGFNHASLRRRLLGAAAVAGMGNHNKRFVLVLLLVLVSKPKPQEFEDENDDDNEPIPGCRSIPNKAPGLGPCPIGPMLIETAMPVAAASAVFNKSGATVRRSACPESGSRRSRFSA
jgi:hypothetical protein